MPVNRTFKSFRCSVSLIPLFMTVCCVLQVQAQWRIEQDTDYIERFHQEFQKNVPRPELDSYATVERYDSLYLGDKLDASLQNLNNESGGMSWGLSYRMSSLNEMYRATGEQRYLDATLKCVRAALAARDDKRNLSLWTGEIAPIWGSGKYSPKGRAAYAVHTGMIVYPMLDFLLLAKNEQDYAKRLGTEYDTLLKEALECLAFHDRQWREGPEPGEGYYVGLNQEEVIEGKPLPGNRLSAMGRALWYAYKNTGNTQCRDRALAIGQYIKRRITAAPDGAYYWGYWLATEPVDRPQPKEAIGGEDISHGSLTMALPMILAEEGELFTDEDMHRLGLMVVNGFARLNNGVLFGDVTGSPKSNPKLVQLPGRWLRLSPFEPEVYRRLADFHLTYQSAPGALDLALLIRHKPKK